MDYTLKKRIIGAIILIVAAIVFVPMLLDGPGQAGTETVDLGIPEPGPDGMRTEVVPLDAPLPPPRVPNEFEVMPDPAGQPAVAPGEPLSQRERGRGEGPSLPDGPTDLANTGLPAIAETRMGDAPISLDADHAADTSGRWHVTLGSYANADNAQKLVADMRRRGFPARAETVTLAGRPAQRVRIGPYADRIRAEAARLAVAARRSDVTPALVQDDTAPGTQSSAPRTRAVPVDAPPGMGPIAAAPVTPIDSGAPAAATEPVRRDARGWVVQIGAFAQVDEANEQVTKLRTAGFAAFVDRLDAPSGTLHRVRIGPEAQRAGADRLQASLKQSLGVDGVVMRHP